MPLPAQPVSQALTFKPAPQLVGTPTPAYLAWAKSKLQEKLVQQQELSEKQHQLQLELNDIVHQQHGVSEAVHELYGVLAQYVQAAKQAQAQPEHRQ